MPHRLPMSKLRSRLASANGKSITDVRSALADALAQLEHKNVPSARLAAEVLLMHTLGQDRAWLYAHTEGKLDTLTIRQYFLLIAQRASGIPTQQLTGHQEFWGLDFEVTPDVLIPRPETEHVIEVALERLGAGSDAIRTRRNEALRIADVGTGSGCLAIALAKEFHNAQIFATDISARALEVSRRNAARHGITSRINFVECNLLDAFERETRQFDLIVSNPPYIGRRQAASLPREVREHEPAIALFGGETGVEIYAPLVTRAATLLTPGGVVVLELGYNAAGHVSSLFGAPEWTKVATTSDLAGIPRVASAERSGL